MSPNAGYIVRELQSSEAVVAAEFSKLNDSALALSWQFCYQHKATIFICLDRELKWTGMLTTYVSPLNHGTAIIEAVHLKDKTEWAVAELLLNHGLQYFQSHCIFKIEAIATAGDYFESILMQQSFQKTIGAGGTYFFKQLLPDKMCLHNRQMRPRMNTINGEVNEETLFNYFQKEEVIWGTYDGGTIKKGMLLGRMAGNGNVDFNYVQLNTSNEVSTGISHASTEFLNDGRIILYEDWEWTGSKSGGGRSVTEEIKD